MNTNLLLMLPILTSLVAGLMAYTLPKTRQVQAIFSLFIHLFLLGVCCVIFTKVQAGEILSTQLGNWPAPYGITFVADLFSSLMILVTSLIAVSITIYSSVDMDEERIHYRFFAWVHFLLTGVYGAFLTGDVFNLYVWFEVMLISSFALLSMGGEKRQLYGTIKYLTMNIISTVLLLTGIGLLYGITGSLNMADLARSMYQLENHSLLYAVSCFLILALGIKAAMFPLFFWLPSSYYVPPVTVSALFGGLLTKVGFYALVRLYALLFHQQDPWLSPILMGTAIATMFMGIFGACTQTSIRRILSFLIIAAMGYLLLGLSLFSRVALMGMIFYMVHDMLLKSTLFLLGGTARNINHHALLTRMGGLYTASPILSFLWLIACFSLAGLPPFSGFWGKLTFVKAGFAQGYYILIAATLFTSFGILYAASRLWNEIVWKPLPTSGTLMMPSINTKSCWLLASGSLTLMSLYLGLFPEFLLSIGEAIASELMDPSAYVYQVLGKPLAGDF